MQLVVQDSSRQLTKPLNLACRGLATSKPLDIVSKKKKNVRGNYCSGVNSDGLYFNVNFERMHVAPEVALTADETLHNAIRATLQIYSPFLMISS